MKRVSKVDAPATCETLPSRLGVLCGLTAIIIPLLLAILVVRFAVNVPYWDEVEWAALILHAHSGTLTFQELWTQHNDHRIFFGKLLALGLASLGGWSQVRECLASVAIMIIGQLFLFSLLRGTFSISTAYILIVPESLLLFSLAQADSWLTGFQSHWFLICACAIAVPALLRDRSGGFLLAVLAGYVASFSSLFGLNEWPAGAISLGLSRPPKVRPLVAWLGFAVVATSLYFYRYQFPAALHAADGSSVFPGAFLLYFFVDLGGPLAIWAGAPSSAVVGAFGFVAYLATIFIWRRVAMSSRREDFVPWFALGAFSILTAAMTSIGRAGLGVEQALQGRYVTPSTLFWVALVSLGGLAFASLDTARSWRAVILVSFGAGLILFGFASVWGFARMEELYAERLADYVIARHYRTATDDEMREIYPSASAARTYLEELQSIGQGPAADGRPPEGCLAACR